MSEALRLATEVIVSGAVAPRRPSRILIVDDDPDVRLVLRRMLEPDGYEVGEAGHGREALEVIGHRPFDLLITDLIMPEQEGIETIQTFHRRYPEVKIIAISG
ncbi:MAG: response regulator, partial [Bryobacterales bacterium]|nr:response regulator [Bryobacterales bacterium]